MIRINLLTEKRKKKKEIKGKTDLLIKVGIATLGALSVSVGVTLFLNFSISQLKKEVESNKATIAGLKKKIAEVKRYEELNKEILYRSSIIETLRKNQALPVKILNDISLSLPDGVWLTALNYKEKGSGIEGYSFGNASIVNFVQNLKRLDILKDVHLVETMESEFENRRVYKFKISFNVKV